MDYITTPHQAELNAERLKSWGFSGAVATTGGADGGLDVRSSRALAQVKWKGGVTGSRDVQKLYGARGTGTEQLFLFSASGYSDQAIKYADQVGMMLMTYDPAGVAEGVNDVAKRFLASTSKVPASAAEAPTNWRLVAVLTVILILVTSGTVLLWTS
ncbi:restriction endonuclease [Rhodococcus sp. DN22]|uniref:restriction endonuclease n=1 Tax=Rhodococcus sp. DN22 TaxID=357684 RepID=UPI0030CBBF69